MEAIDSTQISAASPGDARDRRIAALQAENLALNEQLQSVKGQLDWLKRQLFGPKSERRLVEEFPGQSSLFAGLQSKPSAAEPDKQTITYQRR